MENLRDQYPLRVMLKIFGVSNIEYFEWRSKKTSRENREMDEARKIRVIEVIHIRSKNNYGSPRVADRVRGLGHEVSTSTVARLMRKYKIKSKLKRKFKVTTDSNHKLPVSPNHLMQDFTAYTPNQIWMSDITYIPTKEGWLYIPGIIDLYSRKIVGWTGGSRMTKELVMGAYLKAKAFRKPGKWLIFNSDRGSQYASHTFTKLLKKHEVIQSMSRRANWRDSAPIESF